MTVYNFDSVLELVTKDDVRPGQTWMNYVGQAKSYTEACELAAKDHEKSTGIKGACILVQVH